MRQMFLILLLGLGIKGTGIAQLNQYKYVIVPKMLQDFEEENKYSTSTLLSYLLKEEGFITYYEGDVPQDERDNCEGLHIDLLDSSNLFRTRVELQMKDCNGTEVLRTKLGESRIKTFKEAYEEAIRDAFQSISALGYTYMPAAQKQDTVTLNFDKDVKSVNAATASKREEKNRKQDPMIIETATPEVQRYEDRRPVKSAIEKGNPPPVTVESPQEGISGTPDVWYAQKLPNGYQLVDSSPKIRLTMMPSSLPDVYLAHNDTFSGLVYKKGGHWYFEYYSEGQKEVRELNIKF